MALVDVCRFTPTAGGLTDWSLSSAVTGYQSLSAAGAVHNATYSYRAENANGTEWEIGIGVYNSIAPGTISRQRVLFGSSGAGVKVNFSTTPQVALVALAEDLATPAVLFNWISGLQFSTAGASSAFNISAGVATDSNNVDFLTLSGAISKTTAAWAAGSGSGSLDTGTIAANTAYHGFIIKRIDTGAVDFLVSLSPTAPTMPANYTLKRRAFSCLKTDASSKWLPVTQDGDRFLWGTPAVDVNVTPPGTAAVLRTLSVPSGIRVCALLTAAVVATSANTDLPAGVYISDPTLPDITPNAAVALSFELYAPAITSTMAGGSQIQCMTNTAAQVRSRNQISAAGQTFTLITYGWIDTRGKL